MRQWLQVARSFPRVCWDRGFLRTIQLAHRELWFDWTHGTDTSIDADDASEDAAGHPSHAGANPQIFRELMGNIPASVNTGVFLDLGSGKGRALILAAESGAKKVIGVEQRVDLHRLAKENTTHYLKR